MQAKLTQAGIPGRARCPGSCGRQRGGRSKARPGQGWRAGDHGRPLTMEELQATLADLEPCDGPAHRPADGTGVPAVRPEDARHDGFRRRSRFALAIWVLPSAGAWTRSPAARRCATGLDFEADPATDHHFGNNGVVITEVPPSLQQAGRDLAQRAGDSVCPSSAVLRLGDLVKAQPERLPKSARPAFHRPHLHFRCWCRSVPQDPQVPRRQQPVGGTAGGQGHPQSARSSLKATPGPARGTQVKSASRFPCASARQSVFCWGNSPFQPV